MKERPIIFSAPMVRAILAGTKTQTRRIAKPNDAEHFNFFSIDGEAPGNRINAGKLQVWCKDYPEEGSVHIKCPYGKPGDKLWVKETTVNVEDHGYTGPVYMESDDGRSTMDFGLAPAPDDCTEVEPHELKLRPSTRMPKSMARIWLEVTGVRVERLRDISAADALAEGIPNTSGEIWRDADTLTVINDYKDLWESINGPGSWDANPWVWVIEFRRVEP